MARQTVDPVYHLVYNTLRDVPGKASEGQFLLSAVVAVEVTTSGGEPAVRVQTEPATPETVKTKIRNQIQRRATRRDLDLRVIVE